MTLPGHSVSISETPPTEIAPGDTSAAFVVGLTERGPIDVPRLVQSLAQAREIYGERVSYGAVYDALDVFFREGGSTAYVIRVVGDGASKATVDIGQSGGGGDALTADALSEGEWGNDLDVIISAGSVGGTFKIAVSYLGETVEQSSDLADTDEAVAWAANSAYIRLTKLGTTDPDTGTNSLDGGADDRASIVDADWADALDLLTNDYGPGQVLAPGRTTANGYTQLLSHAASHNRRALLDGADTATVATLTSASIALRGADGDRFSKLLAPWVIVPGLAPGTTRTVAPSALQAGLIARAESEGHNPNEAAAGRLGEARYAIGISQPAWSDSDRETLNDAGVSVIRLYKGKVTVYGDRTVVNPLTDANWRSYANSRLIMAIAADCDEVMDAFDFAQIDGRGNVFAKLGGELRGRALMPYYQADALYGATPEEAFTVSTGPDVNTPSTIAAGELRAKVAATVSPSAERLEVEIVKRAVETG